MVKSKKPNEHEQQIAELTTDLQRMRADFENYRKRVDSDKEMAKATSKVSTIMQLLPVIDNIERAVAHMPVALQADTWAQGVAALVKSLEKSLESLGLKRINAKSGTEFNPEFHEAVQFDEEAVGETEVIAEELQAGYSLSGQVVRHAMVKVTRQ